MSTTEGTTSVQFGSAFGDPATEGPRSRAPTLAVLLVPIALVAVLVLSLGGGSLLLNAVGLGAAPAPATITAPLSGAIGAIPAGAVPVGPTVSDAPVTVSLELALPSSPALTAYEQGLVTPGSSNFQQELSLDQFFSDYGPAPSAVAQLTGYLQGQGLTVSSTGGPWIYTVTGSASEMEAAFHVSLFQYQSSTGALKTAPKGLPSLPADLAPLVGALYGLNQFDLAAPSLQHASPSASTAITPTVMRGFYNETALLSAGDTGSEFAIGLAEMCDPKESTSTLTSDLTTFDSDYGLPAATVHYLGSGATTCSPGSSGWGVETDLDMQWAHVIAPGATLYVCLDDSNPATCDQTFVSDHTSDNIEFGSNSWGGGTADHSVWSSAMADGMTLLASAGDDCEQVNYPAAEPDGLGVGGTTITPSGSAFGSETVWSCSGGEGTGGGCDTADAPPTWQVGMTGFPGVCSASDRGIPDVAMDANPNSGVDIVTGGSLEQVGGTSLASPMWAATLDVIYQAAGTTGFAPPTIYSIAKSADYGKAFHDITSGTNGHPATAGWDPDTGVGSPNIGFLASVWSGGTTSTLTATATATPTSGTAPLAVAFTGSATGGTSPYSYSWAFGDGTTSTTQNPSHTYSTAGTYTATLTVTDSASHTATSSVTITAAAAGSPLAAAASASPSSGTAPLAVAFTGSASGGTSPYSYGWAFGDGTTSTAQNPSHTYTAAGSFTATLTVTDATGATASASDTVTVAAASSGCAGQTTTVALGSVTDCSLPSGTETVLEFKVTEAQWDDYYYVNVYESNGVVASGQKFSVGTGLGGTPSLASAHQTAKGPNAKIQIDLTTEAGSTYGGWGTYWVVVESTGGAGGFCFEPKLSNGALGSGPSCSQPEGPALVGPSVDIAAGTAAVHGPGTRTSAGMTAVGLVLLLGGAIAGVGAWRAVRRPRPTEGPRLP